VKVTLGIVRQLRRRTERYRKQLIIGSAVLVVFVVALGLFIKNYHDSGPTSPAAIGSNHASDAPFDPFATTPAKSKSSTSSFFPSGVVKLPQITLSGFEGGGLHFAPGSIHHVTLSINSVTAIGQMGYIIPTSNDHSYGHSTVDSASWSLSTDAFGKPAYAIVFIQAGKLGVPITCTITVDGHVTSSATTKGPYGRTVCLG
jgi:hypothetical protein